MAGDIRGDAMNIMEVDGYKAKIEYDPELDEFRGEILGLNGSADFYGKDPVALRREFRASLAVFLEVCEEKGIYPTKKYSGKFNLRIPPGLHSKIANRATAENKSINQWVAEVLEHTVNE
jgi:predicted HicB family RNase H-like nuclease